MAGTLLGKAEIASRLRAIATHPSCGVWVRDQLLALTKQIDVVAKAQAKRDGTGRTLKVGGAADVKNRRLKNYD